MPLKNKQEYLAKYLDSSANQKKKKKKRHHQTSAVRIHDDDDHVDIPADVVTEEMNDEDGPVIVDTIEISSNPQWDGPTESRKRYDSEDSSEHKQPSLQKRYRHHHLENKIKEEPNDGTEANNNNRRSKRYDSEDDDSPKVKQEEIDKQSRRLYDSDDNEATQTKKSRKTDYKKRRYDSEDDAPVVKREFDSQRVEKQPLRKRYDSDDEPKQRQDHHYTDSQERMTSGHKAGLQSSKGFSTEEAKIQQRRKQEAKAMVDKYGMGETIYRDQSGKRVERPIDQDKRKQNKLSKEEQKALNTGRVQKDLELAQQRELESMQQSTFARYDNDDKLEEMRKSIIREGDPMADSLTTIKKTKANARAPTRPVYKGPPAKPNRFGIPPGYRWDGVDRGNGFEDKLFAQMFSQQQKKEQAYRSSTADM